MVNCYLGHYLFMDEGRNFSSQCPGNAFFRNIYFNEMRLQEPAAEKSYTTLGRIKKECPKSQFTILGFASEGNLRAI